MLATPSFAEQKVEVTDKIALPGKMSSSTPYTNYTRLILDSSGKNVYGLSDIDNGYKGRATHWSGDNYQNKKDLGSLLEDNGGTSQITSIAQDGKILGGIALNETDYLDREHGSIWSGAGFANKKALPPDHHNSTSYVYALSGDGKVIAGSRAGWSNLAILKNDGSDWTKATELPKLPISGWFTIDDSRVLALSYDGSIAVGGSINDYQGAATRPVVWHGDNWQTITDLGTLKADNIGGGQANAISDDGKIIGGWSAVDDRANTSATIWTGDNWQTKIRLNGLTNYSNDPHYEATEIYALTKDGKIAGGTSTDDSKQGDRPVVWSGDNYEVITDLGTLDANNRMEGVVTSFNGDGTIIAGFSEDANNDRGSWKPVVWKVKYTDTTPPPTTPTPPNTGTTPTPVTPPPTTPVTPTPPVTVTPVTPTPVTPPVVTPTPTPPTTPIVVAKIDVDNTVKTVAKLGGDSFTLMSMQSHALDRLQYNCVRHQGFCFGLQEDVHFGNTTDDNRTRDVAVGANVGYGFGNGLSVGVSLDHSINRKLPTSYRHQGDGVGVGAMVRYRSPIGIFGEVSAAYDNYTAQIARPLLDNTELGVNESKISGTAYTAKVGKEFGTGSKAIRAYVGVSHKDISRDAYTENESTAFPISYGKMSFKKTSAIAGAKTQFGLTNAVSWVSDVQLAQKLSGDDPTFTASLTGVDKYDFAHTTAPAKTTGVFATGVRYQVAPNTHTEFLPYVNKGENGETGKGAVFRLESFF